MSDATLIPDRKEPQSLYNESSAIDSRGDFNDNGTHAQVERVTFSDMLVAFHMRRKPVSLNAKPNPQYAEQIAARVRDCYAGPMLSYPLYSRIIWFHKYRSSQGDVDNIAKRIHDALKGVLFSDDRWITHTMTVRVDAAERVELVANPADPNGAAALVDSLEDESVRDILYIEIGRQSDPKTRLGPLA